MSNHRPEPSRTPSPNWTPTTKLVIGLSLSAILVLLLISFRSFLAPVILAVILAYLIYPWANRIQRLTHIPWRIVVGILYMLSLFTLLGLLAWGGITLIEQVQNLIRFLQGAINDLPGFITRITATPQTIGPFSLDFSRLDLNTIINQLLGIIQPLLSQAGNLVGTVASSAAGIIGWTIFALLLSYFIVSETPGGLQRMIQLPLPAYREDLRRIGQELTIIWNAFLRGQLILFTITASIYTITFAILGVHYYFGLALMAGLARFLPYIGPAISWTTDAIVAFSQGYAIFGIPQEHYMLLVLGTAWVTDTIIDNLISPRLISNALKIHPAAVMVCALIAFNLVGITGIVLAAPVLATTKLIFDYIVHKLLDLDPWADFERTSPPVPLNQLLLQNIQHFLKLARHAALRTRDWLQRLRKSQVRS